MHINPRPSHRVSVGGSALLVSIGVMVGFALPGAAMADEGPSAPASASVQSALASAPAIVRAAPVDAPFTVTLEQSIQHLTNPDAPANAVYPGDVLSVTITVTPMTSDPIDVTLQNNYNGRNDALQEPGQSAGPIGIAFTFDAPPTATSGTITFPPLPEDRYFTWQGIVTDIVTITYSMTYTPTDGGAGQIPTIYYNWISFLGDIDYCIVALCAPDDLYEVQGSVAKSVDVANAAPGDIVTYTIRIQRNREGVDNLTDDLTDVFAHATLVPGSLVADGDGTTVAIDGNQLTWSNFRVGTYTVTFKVRINGDAPAGVMDNDIVPPDSLLCEGAGQCDTEVVIARELALTGSESSGLVWAVGGLLLLGGASLVLTRSLRHRRR